MVAPEFYLSSPALRRFVIGFVFFVGVSLSAYILFRAADVADFPIAYSVDSSSRFGSVSSVASPPPDSDEMRLERVLKNAAMPDNTVILTTTNDAWTTPNSVLDLFLESFRIGIGTRRLLNHMVVIALDKKAFSRCKDVHSHCFALTTEGVDFSQEAAFLSDDYLKMMWRRIDFLRHVLEIGYNFVFTDADIMWFRDPFPHFYKDMDFQIACDHFSGNSTDIESNSPNGGFNFVKSNNRSIEFYKFWYSSREKYPGLHDQDVFNRIKLHPFLTDIGLKMRFLDTAFFGGFCQPSEDLNKVCTMHANCCIGLDSKIHDLRIMLEDWRQFLSLPPTLKISSTSSWSVPQNCSLEALHHHNQTLEEDTSQAEETLQ
ncbi:hypothetical protein DCAR_0726992 [Daucus carota subsp. sativus]|uniref:Glycosyltransferase n=2 Tax=Daucus carota subsp. sativus TaxID=79200 RepID=A0AAF0XGB5_DAUCS|nr:hypothetical protein DCAR_0726992 [Daucus carota subsp. sativus]